MPKNKLADVGQRLLDNGYNILPLNGKRPLEDDWTDIEADQQRVDVWLKNNARCNVGIQTRDTPAVDIDVYDAEVAEEMEAWCLDNLGDAPIRVGQAPKRLLVFRTDEPFRKMKVTFLDGEKKKHQIEILGAGQQFAAFGIHPDTKKPFEWTSIENPLDIPADDLPTLTREKAQGLLDAFEAAAKKRGWTLKGKAAHGDVDDEFDDEALLTVRAPVDDLDDEDIRDALLMVPDAEDYDRWLQVGLALFHQYQGGETGLELWHEWSETAPNYDSDAVDERWQTFDVNPDHGKAITFRTVLEWAKEGAKQKAKDEFSRVKNMISACADIDDLFDGVARKVAKALTYDHQIEAAAKWLQERALDLDGVKRPIDVARKALVKSRNEHKAAVSDKKPDWAKGWVWLEHSDRFYNIDQYAEVSIRSFNARYDIEMLTPEDKALGRAIPEQRAADAALNIYEIPKVRNTVYLPGAEKLIRMESEWCVNIYDGREVPETAEAKTQDQRAALRVVKQHFEVLFPQQRERELLISFLAFQVQYPADRVNWGVLIQGVEGAGKTWFQNLMAGVLGSKNVSPVNAKSLFSDFNGWAEGRKMIFVEEIRLRGHNRYEVLESIKPNLTNDVIEITRKGRDPYKCPNVASYMMFTNYEDAIPVNDSDRRYFILRTMFQSKRQIEAFLKKNPDYFVDLFAAVAEHADVIRGWLMSWKIVDEFNARGRAPDTEAKQHMREVGGDDEHDAIADLVEAADSIDCSEYLLNLSTLAGRLMEREVGVPKTRTMRGIIESMGFTFLGRFKVEGDKHRFYTRRPELFQCDAIERATRVRMILTGETEPEFLG